MKLVVDHAVDPGDRPTPRPSDGSRPALRVMQGGRARPPRLVAPGPADQPPASATPPAPPDALLNLDEVAIYLRPIPAWIPRLW